MGAANYAMYDQATFATSTSMRLGDSAWWGGGLAILATYSCETLKSDDGLLPTRWGPALSSAAIFSFDYAAAPPSGRLLHFDSVSGVTDPCQTFSSGTGVEDFTALNIVTTSNALGSYVVDQDPDLQSSSSSSGYVELVIVEHGAPTAKMRAVSGQIDILMAPADELAWSSTAQAKLHAAADFELDPIAETACTAGQAPGSPNINGSCSCKRRSGATLTCTITNGKNCCSDHVGTTVRTEFEIAANACAAACAATQPELLVYCRDLLGH